MNGFAKLAIIIIVLLIFGISIYLLYNYSKKTTEKETEETEEQEEQEEQEETAKEEIGPIKCNPSAPNVVSSRNEPWECISPYTSPMKLSASGYPECLSYNCEDCAWAGNMLQCALAKDTNSTRSIKCTGNEPADHWCTEVKPYLTGEKPKPPDGVEEYKKNFGGFKCIPPHKVPVRLQSNGNAAECMSFDGKDCMWSTSMQTCENDRQSKFMELTYLKPVKCDGNESSDHWCTKVLPYLKGELPIPSDTTEEPSEPPPPFSSLTSFIQDLIKEGRSPPPTVCDKYVHNTTCDAAPEKCKYETGPPTYGRCMKV